MLSPEGYHLIQTKLRGRNNRSSSVPSRQNRGRKIVTGTRSVSANDDIAWPVLGRAVDNTRMLLNIAATPMSVAGLEPRSNRFKIVAKCGGVYGDWRARNEDAYWKTILRLSALSFGY